nr:hypothetical protein [Tanacetum cinerariifolium]
MSSKDTGGLGVSSLFALNRALMFKWVWQFISQKSSLWASVIKALHGEDGKIGKKIKTSYPSIWLSIIHGVNTSLWDVAWRGDVAFKVLVPRLYALESMKNIYVASKLSHECSGEFSVSSVRKVIDATLVPKDTMKTSELMRKITRWWDMDYMEINSFEEWLEWVSSIRLPLKQKQIFE